RAGDRDDGLAEIEEGTRGQRLGAYLEERGAAVEDGARDIRRLPSRRRGRLGVHDRLQGRKGDQADSARSVFFCCGMNRSMNAVPGRPAWKSGSPRIRRCSGTDVWMPSMTVISSVRRIRAIASCRSRPWTMIFAIIES